MAFRVQTRRGNAAVTALSLASLMGFGALAVDVAWVRVVHAQLQVAVEAGALAGSGYLDGTEAGAQLARERAVHFASLNPVGGGVDFDPGDVELGAWSEADGFVPASDAGEINALRMDVTHNSISALLAGAVFGKNTLSTRASAIAMREVGGPAGEVECFLPMAVPDCAFPDDPEVNPEPITFKFNNQNDKNLGWAHPDGANASNLKDHFDNPGMCATAMGVGDMLPVMNGVVDAAGDRITDSLNGDGAQPTTPWPYEFFPEGPPEPRTEDNYAFSDSSVYEGSWGNVIMGPIALVDMGGGPGGCADDGIAPGSFNGQKKITGFVWGIIYDRRSAGGANAHIMVQLDFVNEHEFGTKADPDARGNITSKPVAPKLVVN